LRRFTVYIARSFTFHPRDVISDVFPTAAWLSSWLYVTTGIVSN